MAIFFSTQIQAANPGDSITAINFGEYASFGGSTWRKARYYDHDTFVSSEQEYFIRLYDNNYTSTYRSDNTTNVFAVSTLITSTLPTFYTNMTNTNNIKTAVLDTNWSTGASIWVSHSSPGTLANTSYHTSKVAIPSTLEVANNSEIFSTATPVLFWLRTPTAPYSNCAWAANSSSSFDYHFTSNTNRVVPGLRLSPTTTILSGAGTSGNPYVLGYNPNATPSIILSSSNTDIILTKDSNLVISGTVKDTDIGDSLAISATIGGITKNANPITADGSDQSWSLSWNFIELSHGDYTNIIFSVSDGNDTGTTTYIGTISIDKQGPVCGEWTPNLAPWKNNSSTTFVLGETPDAGAAGVKLGKGGGTCTTGANHGNTCDVVIEDNNDNTTTCTSPINRLDNIAPECGTWTPSKSTWKVSGGEYFALTSSSDTGGSGLATASANVACSTGPLYGDTCPVTIEDQAGNTTLCTSPINKVDIYPPNLSVTPAISGWQGDKQDIIVLSEDSETSIARIAYAWDLNTLGSDCSGGTTISSGDNLRLTISGGANPLYVCSLDLAGNVSTFTNIYRYIPPVFSQPHLEKQVVAHNLYWNIQSVSETQSYIEVKGFFPKTTGTYNYSLEYIIPTINKSYIQALRTSPFTETHFTIIIPTSDFNPSKDNHTFSGPQKLKITDLDQMEATTIDHNLNFFFPIHQANHRRDFNYFILASDNRVNEVGE